MSQSNTKDNFTIEDLSSLGSINVGNKGIPISASAAGAAEEFSDSLKTIQNNILNINEKKKKDQKNQHADFIDTPISSQQKTDPNQKFLDKIVTKVLDLSNPKDLEEFNRLLNAHSNPKGNIQLSIVDRKYNEHEGKFIVFIMYNIFKFINPLK